MPTYTNEVISTSGNYEEFFVMTKKGPFSYWLEVDSNHIPKQQVVPWTKPIYRKKDGVTLPNFDKMPTEAEIAKYFDLVEGVKMLTKVS